MHDFNIDKFKYRIRLFVELIIVAFVCISAWGIVSERRTVIATAERNVAGYARALAEHSESAFAESDRVLRDLLHDLNVEGGIGKLGPQELFLELRRQAADSPQIGAIFLVDGKGTMFTNSNEFPPRQISVADREYFRYYLNHPDAELTLSKPVMSRLVNRWRFNLMRPLGKPGQPFAGLAAVAFEVSYFQSFFGSASLGPSGRISLARTDGAPLVCEPMVKDIYEIDLGNSVLFREKLPSAVSGTFRVEKSMMDGTRRIVSYQKLKRFPVISIVSVNMDDVLAPWERKAAQQLALIVVVCLVLAYLTRLILRHLDRLKLALALVEGQQEQLRVKAAQIDAANDAILQIDAGGKLIQFNQALCQMTGYAGEELSGLKLQEILAPPFSEEAPDLAELAEQGPTTYEAAFLAKNGKVVPVEVHALTMTRESRPLILNVARDITQRKRSEERESARLQILEAMTTASPLHDLLQLIVRFVESESPGTVCAVILFEENARRLRLGAAPNLPEAYTAMVDGLSVREGSSAGTVAAFLGGRVVIEDMENDPLGKECSAALKSGLKSSWSEPVVASDGKTLGVIAVYSRERRLPHGEELSLLESAVHLASLAIERARGEENRHHLEEQLLHVQKIEAIGQLAAGVAHDFNNLLTPILVFSGMLKGSIPKDDPQAKKVEGIASAALKAKELTQKLLSFGRKQMLHKEVLDLNEVVLSFQDIMARTVREEISFDIALCSGAVDICADRGQIEQILLNLTVNAQDAIEGNGTVAVRTERTVLDRAFVKARPGLKAATYCRLTFSDNGRGMSEETMQHIFEPFFTTKPVGQGTGLGLATVYGIVNQHEGYIEVTSGEGVGTTFDIYLPAAGKKAVPAQAPSPPRKIVEVQGKTVLVVEDNEMVRDMAVDLLVSAGHRVLVAEGPAAAREIAEKDELGIDLLVTDVVMPQMNGPQLYEELAKLLPRLPVLYMSGYADDLITQNLALTSPGDLLKKPFTSELFLESIRNKLAQSP